MGVRIGLLQIGAVLRNDGIPKSDQNPTET